MTKPIYIIGINGSPHTKGATVKMLQEVLHGVKRSGGKTTMLHLAEYAMKPYHGNYSKKPDTETRRLWSEIEKADGIVFATPTHWFGPSSLLKIFVDNLTYWEIAGFKLEGKVVGVISHCWEDGGFTTARDLMGIFNTMGAIIPPYAIVMRNKHLQKNKETEWMWKDTQLLGKNMVIMCKSLRASNQNWGY